MATKIDKARLDEWRARIPRVQRLVEEVVPRMLESGLRDREQSVPPHWAQLVDDMRTRAHDEEVLDGQTAASARCSAWSFEMMEVSRMVRYVLKAIHDDLDVPEEQAFGSAILVEQALAAFETELEIRADASRVDDAEEPSYRNVRAVMALSSKFDDTQMRRFRALRVAESAAHGQKLAATEQDEPVGVLSLSQRADIPLAMALHTRVRLAHIDESFSKLDPLELLEEFNDADGAGRGGTDEAGQGRSGPARALARLSLICGALGYGQRAGEDFDLAIERVRKSLINARSRFRRRARGDEREVSALAPAATPTSPSSAVVLGGEATLRARKQWNAAAKARYDDMFSSDPLGANIWLMFLDKADTNGQLVVEHGPDDGAYETAVMVMLHEHFEDPNAYNWID